MAGLDADTPLPTDITLHRKSRVLEIAFQEPLERFRTLVVSLDEGVLGTDAQPLKPWSVTFDIGG